jgi:hypothetical protein
MHSLMEYESVTVESEWMPSNMSDCRLRGIWREKTWSCVPLNGPDGTFRIKIRFYAFSHALRRSSKLARALAPLICILRCLARISTGTQTIMIELHHVSPHSLQVNKGTQSIISQWKFPNSVFAKILSVEPLQSELPTVSLKTHRCFTAFGAGNSGDVIVVW